MTGLNPETDVILEIYCYITNGNLELLDEHGWGVVIQHPRAKLDAMDEWCTNTHSSTGLASAVLASNTTPEGAASGLLEYIKRFVPEPRTALLAGSSVHCDKEFLRRGPWAEVLNYLHYRILDVSSVKEGVRRWCDDGEGMVKRGVEGKDKVGLHRAREDILESLEEARWWRDLVFRGNGKKLREENE